MLIGSTMNKYGEGNGTPLQYSCLENPMDGGAWWAAVHGVAEGRTRLSDFTFTFHFHASEKEMATHSSVLAWRIPGTGEPDGLPSMGSHRVRHDWSDLAVAVAAACQPRRGASVGCWRSPWPCAALNTWWFHPPFPFKNLPHCLTLSPQPWSVHEGWEAKAAITARYWYCYQS